MNAFDKELQGRKDELITEMSGSNEAFKVKCRLCEKSVKSARLSTFRT
jgi:hypothetical protein